MPDYRVKECPCCRYHLDSSYSSATVCVNCLALLHIVGGESLAEFTAAELVDLTPEDLIALMQMRAMVVRVNDGFHNALERAKKGAQR